MAAIELVLRKQDCHAIRPNLIIISAHTTQPRRRHFWVPNQGAKFYQNRVRIATVEGVTDRQIDRQTDRHTEKVIS